MKVLSTDGLTKLIQLIKSTFIKNTDTIAVTSVQLSTVATSGSYNDLSNKPTIPTVVSTVSASSTNADAVGAKLFYDTVGNIESALNTINSGSNS